MADGLQPITHLDDDAATWVGATWIGQISEADLDGRRLELVGARLFQRARLLVWTDDQPRGFVELPVRDGSIDAGATKKAADALPPVVARQGQWYLPPISVVVCTRDRPDQLRSVLENLHDLDYPHFELLVVDNNPTSGLTAPVVKSVESDCGTSIHLVDAAGQGLSIARNVAIKNAKFDILAFTDDDVVVDRDWLTNLAFGFARGPRVACVCGMVPSAEIITPAQSYFDRRVGWARGSEPAMYDLSVPPRDDSLFPMRVSQYGTGANFAVRKDVLQDVGGFDEGLGVGAPTGGGEDIDMFVRVLLAGHVLVREPSAVVWHRHRRTADELEVQVRNYGLGLGAWISKLFMRPKTLRMVLRRTLPAINHLRRVMVVDQRENEPPDPEMDALYGREFKGVLSGPFALLRARAEGRKAKPLKSPSAMLMRAFDFRGDQNWGDPGNSIAAGRLALTAVVVGLIGTLGLVQKLPTPVLAVAVGVYLLAGPGSLILSWYTNLPSAVLFPLIPAVSIAVCMLVVTGLLMIGIYNPIAVLLGLTAATVIGGLVRCSYLAQRVSARAS